VRVLQRPRRSSSPSIPDSDGHAKQHTALPRPRNGGTTAMAVTDKRRSKALAVADRDRHMVEAYAHFRRVIRPSGELGKRPNEENANQRNDA